MEQSKYRFGTFEFAFEHFVFHNGTKRIKFWNVSLFIGTFALNSGKFDVS